MNAVVGFPGKLPFLAATLIASSLAAFAAPSPEASWCLTGSGAPCSSSDFVDPTRMRQILVLPTGFKQSERSLFESEFARLVSRMGDFEAPVYSSSHRARLLYLGIWIPGGALGDPTSVFGAKIFTHPIRGKALTLRQSDVLSAVSTLGGALGLPLEPWGVAVLFNSTEAGVTANAAPPSFLRNPYGIARFTRSDLEGHYTPTHEMAHAALNFVDEYVEEGFEKINIRMLDGLTPTALTGPGWSWEAPIQNFLGIYEYRLSEVLAANGNDNVDTSRYPSRVSTPGFPSIEYEDEGGMFFGKGTYHDKGRNLMNSTQPGAAPDNGFAYDHSESQKMVVEQALGDSRRAPRPNDRLRNAGPLRAWYPNFGAQTKILLFDADKNHHFHPTRSYDIQIGWYERRWKVCWKAIMPYPCHEDRWVTAQKTIPPSARTLAIKTTSLYGLAGLTQRVLCAVGLKELKQGGNTIDFCSLSVDQMSDAFLPTLEFPLPYQDARVPASQWMTTYWWRFRADNGTLKSGYTGWSKFFRAL